ncbi:MAG: DALR domain-containing protein [Verrucomicrobiota bacterium]
MKLSFYNTLSRKNEVIQRGFTSEALRYLLLSGHYRKPLNFTWESLATSTHSLERILEYTKNVDTQAIEHINYASMETSVFRPTLDALCDDLNTPKALGALNSALRNLKGSDSSKDKAVRRDLARVLLLLGLPSQSKKRAPESTAPPEIKALARQREEARNVSNWQEADKLRETLREKGWEVRDSTSGYDLVLVEIES